MAKQNDFSFRVKRQASRIKPPSNREQAAEMLASIGVMQRERDRIKANMNDRLAKVREQFEAKALPHAQNIADSIGALQMYCEVNRDNLLQGKSKTVKLTSGEISWRNTPPSVSVRNKEGVIKQIKDQGLSQFLRIVEDVNKEAMLAEKKLAQELKGVSIQGSEDFVVKPFETELEEVY